MTASPKITYGSIYIDPNQQHDLTVGLLTSPYSSQACYALFISSVKSVDDLDFSVLYVYIILINLKVLHLASKIQTIHSVTV